MFMQCGVFVPLFAEGNSTDQCQSKTKREILCSERNTGEHRHDVPSLRKACDLDQCLPAEEGQVKLVPNIPHERNSNEEQSPKTMNASLRPCHAS